MNFKKRVNGSWVDTPHYIHNTSTDTITTLPADIYANDTTATVGLKGQTVQSSIPSPTSPVMPQGTGERTENLTPNQKIASSSYSYTITTHPLINTLKNITPNENYTLSWEYSSNGSGGVENQVRLYTRASGTLIKILQPRVSFTLTSEEIANLGALFCYFGVGNTDGYMDKFMLVKGSTAKDYEPYGQYKIPISSANTTTPAYLGEVESIRKIQKLVLTGEENWSSYSGVVYLSNVIDYLKTDGIVAICTHYQPQPSVEGVSETTEGHITFSKGSNYRLCVRDNTYTSGNAFKTYLAAQYAAGTPVTVWYVLANEETAVVNEPLMKIGDYADTLSNISIPVTAGANTLSIGTTLQPSEVTVNYKGWHPVQSVHEYDSNYTIATMQTLTIAQLQTHTISELQGGEWS